MKKIFVRFFAYLTICSLLLPPFGIIFETKVAQAGVNLPAAGSGSAFSFSYDEATGKITETHTSAATGGPVTHTFSHSTNLIQPSRESLSRPFEYNPVYDNVIEDDGFVVFRLDGSSYNISLLVNIRTSKTIGLFTPGRTDFQWDFLAVFKKDSSRTLFDYFYSIESSWPLQQVRKEPLAWPEDTVDYIESINGSFLENRTAEGSVIHEADTPGSIYLWSKTNTGGNQPVANFISPTSVSSDVKICGKVSVNFSGSEFFDKLTTKPAATNNVSSWPGGMGNLASARLFISYQHKDTWARATFKNTGGTWAFERRFEQIKISSDGSFISHSLKGFPAGKYKITGSFYLRNDGNVDGPTRFDVPNSGGWDDYWSNLRQDSKSIEVFQIPEFIVDLSTNPPTAQTGISPTCNDSLQFKYRDTIDAGLTNPDEKTVCEKMYSGGNIKSMLLNALCGMVLVMFDGAKSFFTYASEWLKVSLGVAEDKKMEFPDSGSGAATPAATTNTLVNDTAINLGTAVASFGLAASATTATFDSTIYPLNSSGSQVTTATSDGKVFFTGISGSTGKVKVTASTSLIDTAYTKYSAVFKSGGKSFQIKLVKSTGASPSFSIEPGTSVTELNATQGTY